METIRKAQEGDAEGIARVHVDSWRTTYRGIVPDEYLARLSYERREQVWKNALSQRPDSNLLFVALDDMGRVVGFISGGKEREEDPDYRGELYAIYLLEEMQGHGLGRRLVTQLVEGLLEMGLDSMLVWVLAENPACQFYQALEGQRVRSKPIEIGGVTLEEEAYGWSGIQHLKG